MKYVKNWIADKFTQLKKKIGTYLNLHIVAPHVVGVHHEAHSVVHMADDNRHFLQYHFRTTTPVLRDNILTYDYYIKQYYLYGKMLLNVKQTKCIYCHTSVSKHSEAFLVQFAGK